MSIVRGSRSHPILIQASPTSGEGFGSVEQGTPDDVSTMDCPIVISSSLLDDEADTHNPRDGDTAPTAGQKSVNAHLKSETLPYQEAHETSTPTADTDPDESELKHKADSLISKCQDLVFDCGQSKRKYEEIHRQYKTAAEEQVSELQKQKFHMLAAFVVTKVENRELQRWKSRHIDKEARLKGQVKQLLEKLESKQCPICCDRVAEAKTICGHLACWACLENWRLEQMDEEGKGIHTCAFCRKYLGNEDSPAEDWVRPLKKVRWDED